MDKPSDPLAPIDFITTVVAALVAIAVIVSLAATVFGSGSFLGLGDDVSVCATMRPGQNAAFGGELEEGFIGARPGVRQWPDTVDVCDDSPATAERLWVSVRDGASLVFVLGFLLLSRRVVKRARSSGLFSLPVARTTTGLGWFLLAGLALQVAAETAGGTILARKLVSDFDGVLFSGWSWPVLVAGFATLSVGLVMNSAVPMQDELDATV